MPTKKKVVTKFDQSKALVRHREKFEKSNPRPKPKKLPARAAVSMREYQLPVYLDRTSGVVVLHWARQIGKSFTLAAWAVDRLIHRPGRLVTVLSNSRENGVEFLAKCVEICEANRTRHTAVDESLLLDFESMRLELRVKTKGKVGRIKVLAANPRTARGFSGDLILDEFAFHEDSAAIWEAAEPILASNPDFLCRIASTGNGKHNLFYRIAQVTIQKAKLKIEKPEEEATRTSDVPDAGEGVPPSGGEGRRSAETPLRGNIPAFSPTGGEGARRADEGVPEPVEDVHAESASELPLSQAGYRVSRVTRTEAYAMGVKIYDANTREATTPAAARAAALDKRAYDQNYECAFADENLTLLSHALISAAEHDDAGFICEQDWSGVIVRPGGLEGTGGSVRCLDFLRAAVGPLYAGFDVGRKVDLSVITVLERQGAMFFVRAILRMRDLRLPEQQLRLGEICRLPKFQRAAIDMTGLGLGLFEYAQNEFGRSRIHGINFATSVPATRAIEQEGRKRETVRVTEALAMEVLQCYEDRRIQQPIDATLRDDLRKPERVTTPGGRVSIAATRDEAGHADHFWSLALALDAAASTGAPFAYERIERRTRGWETRRLLI